MNKMANAALEKDLRYDAHSFMNKMHAPGRDPKEQIPSVWHINPQKITLSTPSIVKTPCTPTKDLVRYDVSNTTYQLLTHLVLKLTLPEIEVKEEYGNLQICYCNYPGISFTENGQFIADGSTIIQSFDRTDFALHINKNLTGDVRNKVISNLGQRKELIEWSTTLPETQLCIQPPFLINNGVNNSFPLFRATRSILSFNFKFVQKWGQFIRMRKQTDTGEWEEIPFEIKYTNIPISATIPIPDAYVTYRKMMDAETIALNAMNTSLFFKTFLENDITELIQPRGGSKEHIMSCKFPTICMYLLACIRYEKLDYVNYAFPNGENPIISAEIRYGTDIRQEVIPSEIMEHENHIAIGSPIPIDRGYNMIPFCEGYSDIDFNSTVTFTPAKTPKLSVDFKKIPQGCDCYLRVRFQIYREIQFLDGKVKLIESE